MREYNLHLGLCNDIIIVIVIIIIIIIIIIKILFSRK